MRASMGAHGLPGSPLAPRGLPRHPTSEPTVVCEMPPGIPGDPVGTHGKNRVH